MVIASRTKVDAVRGWIDKPRQHPEVVLAFCAVLFIATTGLAGDPQTGGDYYGDPLPVGAVARLGTIRFRHGGDVVFQTRFAPGDKVLATAGKDRVVRVWDARTGRQLHRLEGHRGEVRDVAFFPAADRLASVSWSSGAANDQTLRLWDLSSGKLIRGVALPDRGSLCVAVAPDGNTVVTARLGGDIDFWDANTGEKLRTVSMASVAARSIVFLNDGKTVATGSIYEKTTQPGFMLSVLDLAEEKPRQTFEFRLNSRSRTADIDPRTGAGCILAPSADGNTLGVASNDGVVRFFDVTRRAFTHEISGLPSKTTALSPDGQLVASGHLGISLRDRTKVEQAKVFWSANVSVTAVHFSGDGRQLAAASNTGVIHVWDLETAKEVVEQGPTHDRWVKAIAFSPNGQFVVTGGMDDKLRCWEVATGRQLWEVAARTNVLASTVLEFTHDGREILLGMRHNRELEYYDAKTGEKSRTVTMTVHGDVLDLSGDQRHLVLARANHGIELVDLETGVKKQVGQGTRIRIDAVALAPDLATVATASRSGGRNQEPIVRLWDINDKSKPVRPLLGPGQATKMVYGADYVCFSSNGQYVAAASQQAILVWDVASGRLLRDFPATGNRMWPIAFSPDSRFIATCHGSEIMLYELATGEEAARLSGHETYLTCIVFHPDGRHLTSGAWDGTTLVWDLSTLADELFSSSQPLDEQLAESWLAISDPDARRGLAAAWALVRHEDDAVAMLSRHLEPETSPAIDEEELAAMLIELEDDDYATRERAMKKLSALGDAAVPHLETTLEQAPSLELRSRITRLIREQEESLFEIDIDELVVLRAIQVLEQIATAPARQLLEELATGDPGRLATTASQQALQRIEQRRQFSETSGELPSRIRPAK